MRITLVRHATLLLELDGRRLLVDPMLDPRATRPPIEGTPNPVANPTVDLPVAAEALVEGLDAVRSPTGGSPGARRRAGQALASAQLSPAPTSTASGGSSG